MCEFCLVMLQAALYGVGQAGARIVSKPLRVDLDSPVDRRLVYKPVFLLQLAHVRSAYLEDFFPGLLPDRHVWARLLVLVLQLFEQDSEPPLFGRPPLRARLAQVLDQRVISYGSHPRA
jgi:hypothetical protein